MGLSSVVTLPVVVQCPPLALPMLSGSSIIPAKKPVPNQVFFPKRGPTSFRPPAALSLTLHPNTMRIYHPLPKKRGLYSISSSYNPPKEEEEESNKFSSRHSKGNKLKFWVSPLSLPVPELEETQTQTETETGGLDWPILKRWDVPWQWQIVPLFVLANEIILFWPGLGIRGALSKSFLETQRLLFLDHACDVIYTAIVHGLIYHFKTRTFQPLPDDIFCYDPKKPFNLRKGWLLWAGVGFASKFHARVPLIAIMMLFFRATGEETSLNYLPFWEPYMGRTSGTSCISIAFVVGVTAILTPMLEEAVYRGFLMVSLTKWFPTPISVLLSAAMFAICHKDPMRFPSLFVSGIIYGFSYAQTRNLLTPITMHVLQNSLALLSNALFFYGERSNDF